jgi:hypothetical protein
MSNEPTFWSILPQLLWFSLAVAAIIALRKPLSQLSKLLIWRIRIGSALKVASFEIGPTIALSGSLESGAEAVYTDVQPDDDNQRFIQRETYYIPNRNLQMVHRAAPSRDPEYAYDVLIYIIPHVDTEATLAAVQHVEYYCGRGWRNGIIKMKNRSQGFKIALATRGPFICTAKLYFTDGHTAIIGRYIDGEMVGTIPTTAEK